MLIAKSINEGNCPECDALYSLEITIVREDVIGYPGEVCSYGDVTCNQCGTWITDLMPEELEADGICIEE